MTSIFIFISGATLLVYSAERLISSLVGVSRGLRISVFLLAIIFTGIEFDDIVLGVALNLEDEQDVALGLVLGTAVSFTGIVLALGAILTPTRFDIPREYIVIFAVAPLIMVVFALREEVTTADAVVLLAPVRRVDRVCRLQGDAAGDGDVPQPRDHRGGSRRTTRTTADPVRAQAVSTMSPFRAEGRFSGWLNLGIAVLALCGIIIGAATVSRGPRRSSTATASRAPCSAPRSSPPCCASRISSSPSSRSARACPRSASATSSAASCSRSPASSASSSSPAAPSRSAPTPCSWHLPVLVGMTALAAYFLSTGQLKRWHGYVLLALYVAYWIVSFSRLRRRSRRRLTTQTCPSPVSRQ